MDNTRASKTAYALKRFLFNFIDTVTLFVEIISLSSDLR